MDTQKENSGNKKFRKVGPYILSHVIGRGAYAVVYEARKRVRRKGMLSNRFH
jgi:hypothetical protein